MGTGIRRYVNLEERYAIYGESGYYIAPFLINMAIVDELKLSMSYNEIEKFIKNTNITLTQEEIKEFLNNKMNEEHPGLKEEIEKSMKNTSSIITFTSDEKENKRKIDANVRKMRAMTTASRYYFEPYSLQYFKNYVSILKEKCRTLFDILDDIGRIRTEEITEEQWKRIIDLDFHINENGDIYYADADRLLDAVVHNVKDLYNKIKQGNNLETYLTFKESKHSLLKDDVFESEIYPRKEVQIKDLHYACSSEFIALSDQQQKELEKERIDNFLYWMNRDFIEAEEYEKQSNPVLKKSKKQDSKN